jgi:hypothetical protein
MPAMVERAMVERAIVRHSDSLRACAEALALPHKRAENPVRYGVWFLTPREPGPAGLSNGFLDGDRPEFRAIHACPLGK